MRRCWMLTQDNLDQIADLFEVLLRKEPDPAESMNRAALEFERVGLLPSETSARKEHPEVFARDAVRDNQLMLDWLAAREPLLKHLNRIKSLDELLTRMLSQERT